MGGRLRALIRKELLAALRDPRSRMMLIMPPLLQLLVFSYAATLEVTNVSIGVLNRDAGRWGVEFVERLEGSPTFTEIVALQGVPQIQTAIDLRQVVADLAVAVAVDDLLQQGGGAGLGAFDLAPLVAEHAGQAVGAEAVLPLLLGQRAHHQRGEHGEELAGRAPVHAGAAADGLLGTLLPAAEDVAKDRLAHALGLRAAAEEAGDVVQHAAVVIAVEGAGEGLGASRLGGVVGQGADQHRQGGVDRLAGGLRVDAELAAHVGDGFVVELLAEQFKDGHGDPLVSGWRWRVAEIGEKKRGWQRAGRYREGRRDDSRGAVFRCGATGDQLAETGLRDGPSRRAFVRREVDCEEGRGHSPPTGGAAGDRLDLDVALRPRPLPRCLRPGGDAPRAR